ncbi:MAG: NUDIX hydrolase [Rhizobiales bacterium]|nr:NUDIX hydrolase [Hyphomicrobiales bacterium]
MADTQAAKLIPAATILLTRDGAEGIEVFMVVRHHQIDFVAGALVFPGGKVDPLDTHESVRDRVDGVEGLDDVLMALRVAAIREAFEECGVLLARSQQSGEVIDGARLASLQHYRDALNKSELGVGEFLEREGLRLAADMLTPFAHWITPAMMPKRFDTHFYIAAAPSDHLAVHDGHESVDSVWIRPADALKEAEAGTKNVIFPTRMNVLKLGRYANVGEAIEIARRTPVVTVIPQLEKDATGKPILRIPVEADYGVTEEPLENVKV